MKTKAPDTVLAVPSATYRYSAVEGRLPGKKELLEQLQLQQNTRPVTAHQPQELMLNKQGYVRGRYRYTKSALYQLCKLICPGAGAVVASLVGENTSKRSRNYAESPALAIRLLNELIQLRFALVQGCGMIIDDQSLRVEGVVSRRYEFYPNLRLFEDCERFAGRQSAAFHEATLAGRQLLIRYRSNSPALKLETSSRPDSYFLAWHFCNSELADCSIRATPGLLRELSNSFSLLPMTAEHRVLHVQGRKFQGNLSRLYAGLAARTSRLMDLGGLLRASRDASLEFPGDAKGFSARYNKLLKLLNKIILNEPIANQVLASMLLQGSYPEDVLGGPPRGGDFNLRQFATSARIPAVRRRTVFDLYNALGRVARTQSLTVRESLEQLAFQVLSNSVTLN